MAEVIETRIEQLDSDRFRLIAVIDLQKGPREDDRSPQIGEGPTRDAVPDKIVRFLIERSPEDAGLRDIHDAVGGNPGTVNRQAWTLANDAPDLQRRLVGWVQSAGRGRYRLTEAARKQLG